MRREYVQKGSEWLATRVSSSGHALSFNPFGPNILDPGCGLTRREHGSKVLAGMLFKTGNPWVDAVRQPTATLLEVFDLQKRPGGQDRATGLRLQADVALEKHRLNMCHEKLISSRFKWTPGLRRETLRRVAFLLHVRLFQRASNRFGCERIASGKHLASQTASCLRHCNQQTPHPLQSSAAERTSARLSAHFWLHRLYFLVLFLHVPLKARPRKPACMQNVLSGSLPALPKRSRNSSPRQTTSKHSERCRSYTVNPVLRPSNNNFEANPANPCSVHSANPPPPPTLGPLIKRKSSWQIPQMSEYPQAYCISSGLESRGFLSTIESAGSQVAC